MIFGLHRILRIDLMIIVQLLHRVLLFILLHRPLQHKGLARGTAFVLAMVLDECGKRLATLGFHFHACIRGLASLFIIRRFLINAFQQCFELVDLY